MTRKDELSAYKSCTMCGKAMPREYEKDHCPACEDNVLFKEVREYIRTHKVTEFELAEVFHISQSKVRKWIRDGRIEYAADEKKMMNTKCQRCGAQITFGTLCSDCMRVMNGGKEISLVAAGKSENSRMRFLSEENK